MVKLPPIINHCYIMLTEQCPLRCEYCYIKDRETPSEFNIDWMKNIKNMFSCTSKPRIIFFGGEPLLKLNLIKTIVEKYPTDFQYQVVTNGIVNFEEFMDEVYEPHRNNFDVQISWDGNNNTRKLLNDNETNNIIYDKIVNQLDKDRILVARCVLNDESVKSFYETYMTFKKLNKRKLGSDFTIAHQPNFSDMYPIDLKNQLELIYTQIQNDLTNDTAFMPPIIYKWITNILNNKNVLSCDIGNYVTIRPNGDLYPCTILSQISEDFKLGNLTDKEIDTELISTIRYKTNCTKSCEYKSVCDGGCKYERIVNFKDDWHTKICQHTCDIYSAIYDTTTQFIATLNPTQQKNLYNKITEFNMWSIQYGNGIETDKNKGVL